MAADARSAFLAEFIGPNRHAGMARERWAGALGRPYEAVLRELVAAGLLTPPSLEDHVAAAHSGAHLKELAKKHNVPHSGRKAEVARRLVDAAPHAMRAAVAEFEMWTCSPTGLPLANAYREGEVIRRDLAEKESLEHIRAGRFREASAAVAKYEADSVFPRGMGMNWSKHDPRPDIEMLRTLSARLPGILRRVHASEEADLKVAACMAYLWGREDGADWCPDLSPVISNGMPLEVAVRMVLFGGYKARELNGLRIAASGGTEIRVRIMPTEDIRTCKACLSLAGTYALNRVPELPNPECTCAIGCRCFYSPQFVGIG